MKDLLRVAVQLVGVGMAVYGLYLLLPLGAVLVICGVLLAAVTAAGDLR